MEEELNLEEEEITREKDRNKKLADKVKTTSEERDAEKARAEKAEADRSTALKDAEFYKNFNTVSAKYQGASEFQDKIREKAALGLDVEEATMLVMTKEGKYVPPVVPQEKVIAGGGSADTAIRGGESKSPQEMNQTERKAALEDAFAKGELSL